MDPKLSTIAKRIVIAVVALGLFPGAKQGCGSEEANETLLSPVQAVTTLLETADGQVTAELVLISTNVNPHQFVDTAVNPKVRMANGAEVPLQLTTPGHYTASSIDNPALIYVPGATYQFCFELDDVSAADQVAGGNFTAVMTAPSEEVSSFMIKVPAFAGDTAEIGWTPLARYGIVSIFNSATGVLVYKNFDFTDAHFDGSKWARLKSGGTLALGVDVFATPGEYTVGVCAVDKVSDWDIEVSAELGVLSGFLIGRCAADIPISVPQ